MEAKTIEEHLIEMIEWYGDEFGFQYVESFQSAQLLTNNHGIVVTDVDGQTHQLEICGSFNPDR
jgi:hypothetical protein